MSKVDQIRTALWSTSWLNGHDFLGSSRLERTKRWIEYYRPLKEALGFQDLWLTDNASDWDLIRELEAPDVHVYRYDERLARMGENDFPYAWRGLYFLTELMRLGYRKIIVCDTDAFILSGRLARHIRELNSGYTSLWSPRYQFPAAEISVLCEDAFPAFRDWTWTPWQERCSTHVLFESAPPFTSVCKDFIGDRYGEFENPDGSRGWFQTPSMDYYTQAQVSIPLTYWPGTDQPGNDPGRLTSSTCLPSEAGAGQSHSDH